MVDSAAVPPLPWRNGAGLTRQLAAGQGWRLSLADLAGPAPFSTFAGSDRVHLPLDGGYQLVVDGVVHEVRALESLRFPGEVPVLLRSVERPTKALNLITRRATCSGSLVVNRLDGASAWPPYVRAVVLLDHPSPLVAVASARPLTLDIADALVAEIHIEDHHQDTKENLS